MPDPFSPDQARDLLLALRYSRVGSADILAQVAAIFVLFGGGIILFAGLRDRPTRLRWFRRKSLSVPVPILGFDKMTDVAAEAERLLKASRVTTAWALAGLGISLLSVFALVTGERLYLLWLPIGIAVYVFGPRIGNARPSRVSVQATLTRSVRPFVRRRSVLVGGLVFLSLLTVFIGMMGLADYVVKANLTDAERAAEAALAREDPGTYRYQGLWAFAGALFVAGLFRRLALWAGQPSAQDALARDDRPPVLLLRSFGDDKLRIRVRSRQLGLVNRLSFGRRERFEELLALMLSRYGPVTTVAAPEIRHKRIGAARESITSPDWLGVVGKRLRSAGHIVLIAGDTQGLLDEIKEVVNQGRLESALFIVPPLPGPDAAERWESVRKLLDIEARLSAEDEGTSVIAVRQGLVHAFTGLVRDDATYQAAVEAALGTSDSAANGT